jgi:threonine synthase
MGGAMSNSLGLICDQCNQIRSEKDFQLNCPVCGTKLRIQYDLEKLKKAFSDQREPQEGGSFLREYCDYLPINQPELIEKVSLNEGQTALIPAGRIMGELGLEDLRFKMESQSPTSSLKDRGTSLCALKALELEYDTLCVASSGNMAASIAAYAARAGLEAVVFIQKDVSPAKIFKIMGYGPQLVRVDGDISIAIRLCRDMLKRHRWFECGPNPYRFTAKRMVAYEIVKQMGGKAPDVMIMPVGGGTGMASAYDGFLELKTMGIIESIPRLIGVQFAACAPVAIAYEMNADVIEPVEKKPCVSDALLNRTPIDGIQCVMAARKTGGKIISITDDESIDAIRQLGSHEGLFQEPAGCVSFAGLKKLILQGELKGAKSVVCTLTGHGLNSPGSAFSANESPEVVSADVASVEAYLKLV